MTDAEYGAVKIRIRTVSEKWIKSLGLGWWRDIELVYLRERRDSCEGSTSTGALAWAEWKYLEGQIKFYTPGLLEMSDKELEYLVVHELCHLLVNEMREKDEDLKHEERVCTQLAQAFLWVRDEYQDKEKVELDVPATGNV